MHTTIFRDEFISYNKDMCRKVYSNQQDNDRNQQTAVMNQQTEVINQQSEFIDHNLNLAYEEYLVTIKESEDIMEDMAILIAEYSEVINNDAIYFEEITERLKRLSIVIPQSEVND